MSAQRGDRIYEVFAARSHERGLEHVGSVHADDVDMAVLYGRAIYDEENWIEMKVVPRGCMHDTGES